MKLVKSALACAFALVLLTMCACASSAGQAVSSPQAESEASPNALQSSELRSASASEESANLGREQSVLAISANGTTVYAELEDNSSAVAFVDLLREGPVTVRAHDYGNFEKVGPLPQSLPTNDAQITTQPGDVILYQGNQVTIYYDQNTWSFTRLAHIEGATRDSLLSLLGDGDVDVTFSLA